MNKIEFTLVHDFNIATRDKDGNFRDIYDVLVDASKIYWDLEEYKKDLLKELIFGNHCSKRRFEECMNTKRCGSCEYTDGLSYLSSPPKVKCTKTGKFHFYEDMCDCETIITYSNNEEDV